MRILRFLLRTLGRALVALVVVLAVLAAGAYFHMRSSLPDHAADQTVQGLRQPVQIVRDRNAVPHIFANSLEDALFGLGYAHAQDRLWQMELTRRLASGRLSELMPASLLGVSLGTPFLPTDRAMRTLGIRNRAEQSYKVLSDGTKAYLAAYAAGVNAWLAGNKAALPPEFVLLQHAPEPWQPVDSLLWGKLMALSLDGNWRREILRARVFKALPDRARDLFPDYPEDAHTTLGAAQQALRGLPLEGLFAVAGLPGIAKTMASNEWVLAGTMTQTGAPLLANDPHLSFEAPSTWYLARLVGPGFDIRGATSPGTPGIVLGHNGRIGWGFTTTNLDSQDLFIEKVDPTNPDRYVTPDGVAPFRIREEIIRVRGGQEVKLRVRETRHGPVVSDLIAARPGQAGAAPEIVESGHVLALQAVALDAADTTAEALVGLNLARNWDEFQAALRRYVGPMQNIVYADIDGNIGFTSPGRIPIRRNGSGSVPAPGWSGEYDWSGIVPFEQLPRAFNPASGRIVNANARVAGPDYPYFMSRDWAEPYRQQRAANLIALNRRHTASDMISIQADALSPDFFDVMQFLLRAQPAGARERQAIDRLQLWDGRMLRDRPEPLIYTAWVRALHRTLYADELGEALFADFFYSDEVKVPLHLLQNAPHWCDDMRTTDRKETCEEITGKALGMALDDLAARYGGSLESWRWGDAHPALFRHRLFDAIPPLRFLGNRSIAVDGGFHTLNRAAPSVNFARAPYAALHGATLRTVLDFSDLDRSRFIVPLGQSGNPLSPWYDNALEDWADLRALAIAGRREDVQRRAEASQWLRPSANPAP
ncbi:MAG: penicillin acylase family protein [Reyranellaceae bacterium]